MRTINVKERERLQKKLIRVNDYNFGTEIFIKAFVALRLHFAVYFSSSFGSHGPLDFNSWYRLMIFRI